MKKVAKNIGKFLLITLGVLLVLLVLLLILLRSPSVQNYLVSYSESFIEKAIGTEIKIGKVDFHIPYKAVLENVVLYDLQDEKMIAVEKVKLDMFNYSLWNFIRHPDEAQYVSVSGVEVINPDVFIYRLENGGMNTDLFKSNKEKESKPMALELVIDVPSVKLSGGRFRLKDPHSPEGEITYKNRVNFKNLEAIDIHVEGAFWMNTKGKMKIKVNDLGLKEKHTEFVLDHLSTDLLSDSDTLKVRDSLSIQPFLLFQNLKAQAQGSRIHADVKLPNQSFLTLFDKEAQEYYEVNLRPTEFDFASLNYFLKKPVPLEGVVHGEGIVIGDTYGLRSQGFQASFRDQTKVNADVYLDNFRNSDSLWIDVKLNRGQTNLENLQSLLPDVPFPDLLSHLGVVGVEGSFKGLYYDFDINADVETDAGDIYARLNLILPPKVRDGDLAYKGYVETEGLRVDEFGIENFIESKSLTFAGDIEGRGTKLSDINTAFKGKIMQSDLFGYEVDSLVADIKLQNDQIKGHVRGVDKDGRADVFVDLLLTERNPAYVVRGQVRNFNLKTYKVMEKEVLFSGDVDIDVRGDSLEALRGYMELKDAKLVSRTDTTEMKIPEFVFRSEETDSSRIVSLKSSLLDAYLEGNFTYRKAYALTNRLIEEARLFFRNNKVEIDQYYRMKVRDSVGVAVKFEAKTNEYINEIFYFLKEPLYISPDASITGLLTFNETDHADFKLSVDSVSYKNTSIKNGAASMDLTKYADQNVLIMVGDLGIDSLHLSENMLVENFGVDVSWFDNQIECDLYAEQKQAENFLNIFADIEFFPDGLIEARLGSQSTAARLGDYMWRVQPNSLISYHDKKFHIDDLVIRTDTALGRSQNILIDGTVAMEESEPDTLLVKVKQLQLSTFDAFIPERYALLGELDAAIFINDLITTPKVNMDAFVNEFGVGEFHYGNILAKSDWDPLNNRISVNAEMILYEVDTLLNLTGYYDLGNPNRALNFRIETPHGVPMNYLTPFVEPEIYDIDGKLSLESFTITGAANNPVVLGRGKIKGAAFSVNYFKTRYRFDGEVKFDEDRISLPTMVLYDKFDKTAKLRGVIRHRGLKEFTFDIQLDEAKDFLVLDTKKEDNELFYGTIFVKNGIASVTGNIQKLIIEANAITGANSIFKLPLSSSDVLGRPDYIHFVGDANKDNIEGKDVVGFDINLQINATPDVQAELIFDERVGDIIRGRGEGSLNLQINEEVGMAMYGEYTIMQGDYLFTSQNVVNKRFFVKPGGKVRWSGDPYDAQMDLLAAYPVFADIKDVTRLEESLRIPINVLMKLEGSLTAPNITPSIEPAKIDDDAVNSIVPYLKAIHLDEQELNKQVFSLIIFNRFAPITPVVVSAEDEREGAIDMINQLAINSVSELLSNQLTYWLSQAINDKVNVVVGSNNLQDVTLLVQAKFFNDRLTIERDGTLVGANTSFALGNISLKYKLLPKPDPSGSTPDRDKPGELILEGFTRENVNNQLNNTNQEAGAGVFYNKEFDSLKDLFTRKRKKRRKKKKKPE